MTTPAERAGALLAIAGVIDAPHGGFGQSGYGKDLSVYTLEEYTRIKHVMVSLA